jgi:hypothetical protein
MLDEITRSVQQLGDRLAALEHRLTQMAESSTRSINRTEQRLADLSEQVLAQLRSIRPQNMPEHVLAELFAAVRDLQWQQGQQADRVLKLLAEGSADAGAQKIASVIDVHPRPARVGAASFLSSGASGPVTARRVGGRSPWVVLLVVLTVIVGAAAAIASMTGSLPL